MIDLATESDIRLLRQVALLQEREIQRLHARLAELLAAAGADVAAIQGELEALRIRLAQREQALFGLSSEKHSSAQPSGDTPTTPPRARRGHGPTAQPRLPVVEQVFTLPDDQRTCAQCGRPVDPMGGQFEDAEEITVVERQFVVTRQRRQKYRCQCNAQVVTAPGPVKLQEGGRYSPAFAVEVAASKYLDHLPLERQVRVMAREGLTVTSQTLWDQIEILARVVRPTYEAIHDVVLRAPVIGADETHWQMMGPRRGSRRWYGWCLTSPDAAYFEIHPHRSADVARRLLEGYRGIVMADGYEVYETLAGGDRGFVLARCWAHVRRKYLEIQDYFPTSAEVVDLIRDLYDVERQARDRAAGDPAKLLEARRTLRATESAAIVAAIQRWVLAQRVLPEDALAKAIGYMTGLWRGLTLFLTDPRVPLDNSATERALRGPVVGRKNFYGARSKRGADVAAVFYTLFETAKLRGDEPKAYLRRSVEQALLVPGTVTLPTAG
jgi:transposase